MLKKTVMKRLPWLVFGCSMTLLLLANFVTYTIDDCHDGRGLPLVYDMSDHCYYMFATGFYGFFRPLVLAIDIVVAFFISGLIGLFAFRLGRTHRVPRTMFLLAILAFAATDIVLLYRYEPSTLSVVSDFSYRYSFAPYRYYAMLAPSLVLTISGLIWLLVSRRRRRAEPSSVAE